jgi:hypothetical protein
VYYYQTWRVSNVDRESNAVQYLRSVQYSRFDAERSVYFGVGMTSYYVVSFLLVPPCDVRTQDDVLYSVPVNYCAVSSCFGF